MKRIKFILLLMLLIVPIKVGAANASVSMSCLSTLISPGSETSCTITGNTQAQISSVSMTLNLGSELSLVEIVTDSSWQGNGEGGQIELYTDNNKTGNFPIATFKVKAGMNETATKINLENIVLYDNEFKEIDTSASPLDITISELAVNNTENTNNTSTSTDNPKTFDSNLFGIFIIILIFGIGIYLVVKKQNKFFKKI